MIELTKKQRAVYDYILSEFEKTSIIPGVSDIARHFHIDKHIAFDIVGSLERKGKIKKINSAIALSDSDKKCYINKKIESEDGTPPSYFSLDDGSYFSLNISSDEMKNIGIVSGDLCIFKREKEAESGKIVLCRIGEEGSIMLRRIYKRHDGIFELIPENDSIGKSQSREVEILGILVLSSRRYGE